MCGRGGGRGRYPRMTEGARADSEQSSVLSSLRLILPKFSYGDRDRDRDRAGKPVTASPQAKDKINQQPKSNNWAT